MCWCAVKKLLTHYWPFRRMTLLTGELVNRWPPYRKGYCGLCYWLGCREGRASRGRWYPACSSASISAITWNWWRRTSDLWRTPSNCSCHRQIWYLYFVILADWHHTVVCLSVCPSVTPCIVAQRIGVEGSMLYCPVIDRYGICICIFSRLACCCLSICDTVHCGTNGRCRWLKVVPLCSPDVSFYSLIYTLASPDIHK